MRENTPETKLAAACIEYGAVLMDVLVPGYDELVNMKREKP
jgi:hypothetical protein